MGIGGHRMSEVTIDKEELKELIRQVIREELNPHNFNIHIHYPQQQSWANVPMCTTTTAEWAKPLWADKEIKQCQK